VYEPRNGDRVIVTRRTPKGEVLTYEGVIGNVDDGLDGFTLIQACGLAHCYAGAATMLRNHAVVQTIDPA
jgi:hypothetical protein